MELELFPLHGARPFYASHLLLSDPLQFLIQLQAKFGDFVHYRGLRAFYFVNAPPLAEEVFRLEDAGDQRGGRPADAQTVEKLLPHVVDATGEMLERWAVRIPSNISFDVAREMHELALDVASRALLSAGSQEDRSTVRDDLAVLSDAGAVSPWPAWPGRVGAVAKLRSRSSRRSLDRLVPEVAMEGDNLLALLAQQRSTSTAMAWTWYFLATHNRVRRRLFEEVDHAWRGVVPRAPDLSLLPYTTMVVQEAMRLAPPTWLIERQAPRNTSLGGHQICRGARLVVCPYTLHRHPDSWSAPARFNPERFHSECRENRQAGAYAPFGTGPDADANARLATAQVVTVLAMVAAQTQLLLDDHRAPHGEAARALALRQGLRVRAFARNPGTHPWPNTGRLRVAEVTRA